MITVMNTVWDDSERKTISFLIYVSIHSKYMAAISKIKYQNINNSNTGGWMLGSLRQSQ